MIAKRYSKLACCVAGATLIIGYRAHAGPYPLDQLMVWLESAEMKLAVVEATIADLKEQIAVAEKTVAKLEKVVADGKSPPPSAVEQLKKARTELEDLRHRLAEAFAKREAILDYIEWIRIQIAAWEEMDGKDASS